MSFERMLTCIHSEMKIKLNAANQKNCDQAVDLEQREKLVSEYKSELEKVKSSAPVTKDSDCQTDCIETLLLDQECQTECNKAVSCFEFSPFSMPSGYPAY